MAQLDVQVREHLVDTSMNVERWGCWCGWIPPRGQNLVQSILQHQLSQDLEVFLRSPVGLFPLPPLAA